MAVDTEVPTQKAPGPTLTWTDLVNRYPELATGITTFKQWQDWQKGHPSVPVYMWEFKEALQKETVEKRGEEEEEEQHQGGSHPLHFHGEDKLGKYLDEQTEQKFEIDRGKVRDEAVETMIKLPEHNFERMEKLMLDDWLRRHPGKTAESEEAKTYKEKQTDNGLSQYQIDSRNLFKQLYKKEINDEMGKVHARAEDDPWYQQMNKQAKEAANKLIEKAKKNSQLAFDMGKVMMNEQDEKEIHESVRGQYVKNFAEQNPQKAAAYAKSDEMLQRELERLRKEEKEEEKEEQQQQKSNPIQSFIQKRIKKSVMKRVSNIEPTSLPSTSEFGTSGNYIDSVNNWVNDFRSMGDLRGTARSALRSIFGRGGTEALSGLGSGSLGAGAEGLGAAAAGGAAEAGAGAAAGLGGAAGGAAGGVGGAAAAGGAAVGGPALIIILIIVAILLILFVFWMVFMNGGGFDQNGNEIPGLTLSLEGPPTASLQQTFDYTITTSYSGNEDITINDPIPAGTSFVSASCNFTNTNNTIVWRLKDNFFCSFGLIGPLGPVGSRQYTFSLTVKVEQDDTTIINQAFASLPGDLGSGGSGSTNTQSSPSNNNTCNNKYSLSNPLGNFGDSTCGFSRDSATSAIQQSDPASASRWINIIVPCESNWNPNSYNGHAVDPAGAWGLFQMGRGKNGPLDHGDVNWTQQISNAIAYNGSIRNSFSYWDCAR